MLRRYTFVISSVSVYYLDITDQGNTLVVLYSAPALSYDFEVGSSFSGSTASSSLIFDSLD